MPGAPGNATAVATNTTGLIAGAASMNVNAAAPVAPPSPNNRRATGHRTAFTARQCRPAHTGGQHRHRGTARQPARQPLRRHEHRNQPTDHHPEREERDRLRRTPRRIPCPQSTMPHCRRPHCAAPSPIMRRSKGELPAVPIDPSRSRRPDLRIATATLCQRPGRSRPPRHGRFALMDRSAHRVFLPDRGGPGGTPADIASCSAWLMVLRINAALALKADCAAADCE